MGVARSCNQTISWCGGYVLALSTLPWLACLLGIVKALPLKICLRLYENKDVFYLSSTFGVDRSNNNKNENS